MGSQPTAPVNFDATSHDDGGWDQWRALAADTFARFHNKLLANRSFYPQLASFDAANRASATRGTFAGWWGSDGEVRETINALKAWGVRLHEWGM